MRCGNSNKEIAFVYEKVLNRTNRNSVSVSVSQAIFSGDAQRLQSLLEDFMLQSISGMDGANEGFYHGMMLGLCAVLGNRYQVRSNRESGLGRFDIQLTPLVPGTPGFLFEFKHTKMNMWIWQLWRIVRFNKSMRKSMIQSCGMQASIRSSKLV